MAGASGDGGDRSQFNTRIGYILAMVGSAVGLGNIVRFPFTVADNGGAAFVFIYIIAVVLLGIPMVLTELTLGRRSQRNVVDTFIDLSRPEGSEDPDRDPKDLVHDLVTNKWFLVGAFFVFVNVFVMGWYSIVGGWTLRYLVDGFSAAYWQSPGAYFDRISTGPMALLFHALFISITVGIVAAGVSDSIEPVVTFLMPILALLLIGLAVYAVFFVAGSGPGLGFYLNPDFSSIQASTITAAVGQAFFSMSVGFGALITYASYMDRDSDLTEDGLIVGFSDTGVALTAGFVVFPLLAAFALLGSTSGGLGVAFEALPTAFSSIGGSLGIGLGTAFFFLLFGAALSSSISLLEVGVGFMTDRGFPRVKSAILLGLLMYSLGIVMAFSSEILNLLSGDVTGIMVTLGALFIALFLGWVYPQQTGEDAVAEMEHGTENVGIGKVAVTMVRYPIPIILSILLGLGVLALFGIQPI